jgi:hypothetical protein
MEWEKDKPLFEKEVGHPIATIDMEWEKEKHHFGKEVEPGCKCSLCTAPSPLPRRELVNYQGTVPGVFEPVESIVPRATTNPGRSAFTQLPSVANLPPLWAFSRSAGQFLPQSNSIPAPSHSTKPGAKASSASTPPSTWMQAAPALRDNLTKTIGVPPPLPPSVEEAYRRKCVQLKQRMNEVEEANDASRQRLARLNRQIQKMRLERAFLLEQLAKRTSTNVEDSEGSPSPPPTVRNPLPHPNRLLSTIMRIDGHRQANAVP